MIVLDTDYSILAANTAYQRHFATADKPYIGHKCFQISHHYDVPCAACAAARRVRYRQGIVRVRRA
jgi:hypothetical protein